MIHTVTGCQDCIFKHDLLHFKEVLCEALKRPRTIEKYPNTPEWCPLKQESITIQIKP